MSETILDNQEVTAETLNDIAIDLGSTSFNGFGTEKFGANELNAITAELVSSGILISGNQCKPSISDGVLYIDTGIIVFDTGAKIKITEAVALELTADTYVYALNDTVSNTCSIVTSKAEPTEGDFVMLAEVDSELTLTDKRMCAAAKYAPVSAAPVIEIAEQTVSFVGGTNMTYTLEIGSGHFQYALIPSAYSGNTYVYIADNTESEKIYVSSQASITLTKQGTSVLLKTVYNASGGMSKSITLKFI